MKIGIYDPYLDTMSGGERYMLSITRCLAKNHQVSLFWDPTQEEEIKNEAQRRFAMDLKNVSFVPSIFTPETSLLQRIQKSTEYDLIVVLSDGSIPLLGCSMLLHFQTPTEWVKINPLLNALKFLRVNHTIVNSKFTKRYIDKKYGVNSIVLYPPIDLPEKKAVPKEHIILNVGRFGIRNAGSSFKKQDALRDAFIKLYKSGEKNWKMVFIVTVNEQEDEAFESFKKSVEGYPITVIESPDLKTVEEYYLKASIYWHAAGFGEDLKKNPDRAEHFGITTVEAMHYKAVPVVINAGGQPEIITDGENGYVWNTEEELLEKTKLLIADKALCESLGKAAEERAAYFKVERFCEELSNLV